MDRFCVNYEIIHQVFLSWIHRFDTFVNSERSTNLLIQASEVWLFISHVTINWKSLGCGQNKTFEKLIFALIFYKPNSWLINLDNNCLINRQCKHSSVAALLMRLITSWDNCDRVWRISKKKASVLCVLWLPWHLHWCSQCCLLCCHWQLLWTWPPAAPVSWGPGCAAPPWGLAWGHWHSNIRRIHHC